MGERAPTPGPAPIDDPAPAGGSARLVRTLTLTIFLQWLGATALVPLLPVYVRRMADP